MTYGVLYMVGVPIGHYDDITLRAINTLKTVPTIAAEDTRKAKKLLAHLLIQGKHVISHGSHNEHSSVNGLISLLQQGNDLAYISDAGMPGISDPGYMLVRAAIGAGVNVKVIPGVTAATTAVSISGIPCDRFTFQGFIPRKKGERARFLQSIQQQAETQIFYEAPHRVLEMLGSLAEFFPERACCVGRELTKTHEEFVRGTVQSVYENFVNRDETLGEFTIVMAGRSAQESFDLTTLDEEIELRLNKGEHAKSIRDELHAETGLSKKEIYQRILNLK